MELSRFGFIPAGEWITKATIRSGIAFILTEFASDRVVYSFVVDGTPKYIGICEKDTTTLKKRMERYKGLQGAGTNQRISAEIRHLLDRGKKVEIHALKPPAEYIYAGLQVDLVKGLENPLTASLKPEWNR